MYIVQLPHFWILDFKYKFVLRCTASPLPSPQLPLLVFGCGKERTVYRLADCKNQPFSVFFFRIFAYFARIWYLFYSKCHPIGCLKLTIRLTMFTRWTVAGSRQKWWRLMSGPAMGSFTPSTGWGPIPGFPNLSSFSKSRPCHSYHDCSQSGFGSNSVLSTNMELLDPWAFHL